MEEEGKKEETTCFHQIPPNVSFNSTNDPSRGGSGGGCDKVKVVNVSTMNNASNGGGDCLFRAAVVVKELVVVMIN